MVNMRTNNKKPIMENYQISIIALISNYLIRIINLITYKRKGLQS